jgi:putative transposase
VAEVLRRAGWVTSLTRVQRVRRQDNLLAVRRRRFVVTTDSDHDFLVYPNLAQYMVLTPVTRHHQNAGSPREGFLRTL